MSDNPTITIVLTYYNRKKQLANTLRSIARYGHDVNIIIINDGSTDGEDIYCFETDKISAITLENKTWINPCIPFNIGFSLVNTDIVIIQNAECLHIGDIVGHALANSRDGSYLSYSAFYTNKEVSEKFNTSDNPDDIVKPYMNTNEIGGGITNGWYNHATYRPEAYHFCSAITKNDLYRIGGFDERYAKGSAYDDDDFILRIKRAGIVVSFVYSPFVVHQWHEPFYAGDIPTMMAINYILFDRSVKSGIYDVKPFNRIFNEQL